MAGSSIFLFLRVLLYDPPRTSFLLGSSRPSPKACDQTGFPGFPAHPSSFDAPIPADVARINQVFIEDDNLPVGATDLFSISQNAMKHAHGTGVLKCIGVLGFAAMGKMYCNIGLLGPLFARPKNINNYITCKAKEIVGKAGEGFPHKRRKTAAAEPGVRALLVIVINAAQT